MAKPETKEGQTPLNTDADRYPPLGAVIRAVIAHEEMPEGPIERLEITTLASGEATARVWTPRAEGPVGVYLSPGDLG